MNVLFYCFDGILFLIQLLNRLIEINDLKKSFCFLFCFLFCS